MHWARSARCTNLLHIHHKPLDCVLHCTMFRLTGAHYSLCCLVPSLFFSMLILFLFCYYYFAQYLLLSTSPLLIHIFRLHGSMCMEIVCRLTIFHSVTFRSYVSCNAIIKKNVCTNIFFIDFVHFSCVQLIYLCASFVICFFLFM